MNHARFSFSALLLASSLIMAGCGSTNPPQVVPTPSDQTSVTTTTDVTTATDTSASATPSSTTDTTNHGPKSYTAADVAKHAAADSCWLIIRGNVYDVTNFIDQHPGGPDAILKHCGQDATAAFETRPATGTPHPPSADAMLEQLQIGVLAK